MHVLDGPIATPLADAALADEDSADVYHEIVTRRIRMTIDPEFSDYESRNVAEQRAKPFVALTTEFIRDAAGLIDETVRFVVADGTDATFHPQYSPSDIAAATFRRLVAHIWAPLPDHEESDFYWTEMLCSAVLSNYVVVLIVDANTRNPQTMRPWLRLIDQRQGLSLTHALARLIEPILGNRAEELATIFDPVFQSPEISAALSFARSRIDASALGEWAGKHLIHLLQYQRYAAAMKKAAVFGTTYAGDPVMYAIDDWITAKKALWGRAGESPQGSESAASPAEPNNPIAQTRAQSPSQVSSHPTIRMVWFATHRAESKSGSNSQRNPGTYFDSHSDATMHYGRCGLSAVNYHGTTPPRSLDRGDVFISGRSRIDDERAFCADISAALAQLPESDRQIAIYIHGFNTSFDDAVINAGHIALGLEFPGIAICYSWPTPHGISVRHVPIVSRIYHRASVRLRATRYFLPDLLTAVNNIGGTQIHLIAHSMGCDAIMEALYNLSLQRTQRVSVGQLLLAAADVDIGTYKKLAPSCASQAERATMYASDKDGALLFSSWVNHVPRAGLIPPRTIAPGIDTIDISYANTSWTGHDYYMDAVAVREDMAHVVRTNDPPTHRKWLHGHTDSTSGRDYWRLFYVNLKP